MKVLFKILPLLLLILSACNSSPIDDGTTPAPLFSEPQTIEVNTKEGYKINPVTGDSIKPLINSLGDTIKTGISIPAKGKIIHRDSITKPKAVKAPSLESLERHNSNPNLYKIPENIPIISVDNSKVETIPLKLAIKQQGNKLDTAHYILGKNNDTIPTGIPIPAHPKIVKAIQPKPTKALSPVFKDNANVNIKYIDVDQGMLSPYVYCVLEDSKGNLWFGTYSGVSVYDGKFFRHFTDKEGLSNNYVKSIIEDKRGNIWIATDGGGVSIYDGETFSHFTEKEGLSNNKIYSILEDKTGKIWLGTFGGGISVYDPNGFGTSEASFRHLTKKEGLNNNKIRSIIEDKKGKIWIATDGGGVNIYDTEGFGTGREAFRYFTEKEGLSKNIVFSILEDKSGNIWIGTWGGGVSVYDYEGFGTGKESFRYFTEEEGLSHNKVLSIFEDKMGSIWLGTESGGISIYDSDGFGTGEESFKYFTEKDGLSNNKVRSIIEDQTGNIWLGTESGGVNIYDRKSFKLFTEKDGLNNNTIRSIIEDKKGNIWLATLGNGVSIYDGESFRYISSKEGLNSTYVLSVIEDSRGNIWMGTYGRGVIVYSPEGFGKDGASFRNFTNYEGLSNNIIYTLIEDKRGNIWIGTEGGGVSVYNPEKDSTDGEPFIHFTDKEGLSNNSIRSIFEDKRGNIWIGTVGGGVSVYTPDKDEVGNGSFIHFTDKEGLSGNIVLPIIEDKRGNIWLGTWGGGVSIYDLEGFGAGREAFKYFTEKEGLSNNIVWSFLEDKMGNIWLGTEKGLDVHLRNNSNKINTSSANFKKQDGLKGLDFFDNSALIDSENRAWWGTSKGLTMLDLNTFQISQSPPNVNLRNIDINERFIDYRKISDSLDNKIQFSGVQPFDNYPLNLELSYDKNHLTFYFVGIDWSAPHKIQYSYRMLGLNSNWSTPTQETKADYRNLPYGVYTFQIRAIGESGEWSKSFEYSFTIHPPWWHTIYAKAGYGVLGILFIISTVKWRTHKLKKRQQELEKEVDLATKEIRQQKEKIEVAHQETQKQKKVVEEKNKEILDSITYAKRLQDAILPSNTSFNENLKNGFILYIPKDVVSGDFYFMDVVEEGGRRLIYYVAADCTGHGVPGAMVSIVGANGLKRCIQEFGLRDPGEILDKLSQLVAANFSQSEEKIRDGMDLALCCLEMENDKAVKVHYAGANNPLWVINPNRTEVPKNAIPFKQGVGFEIKANKQAIGYTENIAPFDSHTIDLEEGDTLYTFSDGYPDQFGGEGGKKYKSANFKNLLLSIYDKNMDEQKMLINKEFEDWKGELEQLDDVCVIGVRL